MVLLSALLLRCPNLSAETEKEQKGKIWLGEITIEQIGNKNYRKEHGTKRNVGWRSEYHELYDHVNLRACGGTR